MLYFSKLRIILVTLVSLFFVLLTISNFIKFESNYLNKRINLGLDLQGGSYLLLEIDNKNEIMFIDIGYRKTCVNYFKNGRIEWHNPRSNGQNFLERSTHKPGETVDGYVQVERRRYVKNDELQEHDIQEHERTKIDIQTRNDGDISCEWGNKNALSMDFNGFVHPCCYFQNPYLGFVLLLQSL